jgi:hypothetical protein
LQDLGIVLTAQPANDRALSAKRPRRAFSIDDIVDG